jgi:AcrR family transcriptional regulator
MSPVGQGGKPDAAARVVAAAVDRLREHGVTVGLDQISLEHAIAASGVSRATAYRRWPSRQEFLREVLIQVVRQTRLEPETEEDLAALRGLAESQGESLASEPGRRTFVVESFRLAAESEYLRLAASREWRDHLALRATCDGLPGGELRDTVAAELADAEKKFATRRAAVYARLPALLTYRLVPWLDQQTGFDVMAAAAGAIMTGLIVRPGLSHSTAPFRARAFGSTIEAQWTIESYSLVALILSYLEPDPEIEWNETRLLAALAQWDGLEHEVRPIRNEDPANQIAQNP